MAHKRTTISALVLVGIIGSTLTGCAEPSTPSETDRNAAACSKEVSLNTKSELRNWWDGNSLPITWKASVEKNSDWDGTSRPDHAPPQGFQGLVQTVESGTLYQRLEYSSSCSPVGDSDGGYNAGNRKTFDLTPTVSIDGQTFDLMKIEFANYVYPYPWPYVMVGSKQKYYDCGEAKTYSQKTPRGYLYYNVHWDCTVVGESPTLTIQNYSRK